jgi:hypothetical protein
VNGVCTPAFILTAVSDGERQIETHFGGPLVVYNGIRPVIKAVPLHAMEALGGKGGIAPTHSRPRH